MQLGTKIKDCANRNSVDAENDCNLKDTQDQDGQKTD